jgi:hypothetical protein
LCKGLVIRSRTARTSSRWTSGTPRAA